MCCQTNLYSIIAKYSDWRARDRDQTVTLLYASSKDVFGRLKLIKIEKMAFKKAPAKRSAPEETETQASFELDSKKQVTVRKFNGVSLVDIREFYLDKDTKEQKPGKKGTSLTREVWIKLLESRDEINAALDELEGKKRKVEKDAESAEAKSDSISTEKETGDVKKSG